MSVVVCAFTEERWDALLRAVESVRAQRPHEVLIVVDHHPGLLARAAARFADAKTVSVLANTRTRGLSGARNTGVAAAHAEIVAFLDDDAEAGPGWLRELTGPFADPAVIATGGLVTPVWESGRPRWLPDEFLWVVGCSHRGLPEQRTAIRNPVGANMAFRRRVLRAAGGFAEGIGRVGTTPLGCEETELAIRARRLTGGCVLHLPSAGVAHRVPRKRASWRYFGRRCWSEGVSKAAVRERVGTGAALAAERGYVLRTLPSGVARGLADAARGEVAGLARAGAIVIGLALTTAGYVYGIARGVLRVSR